MAVTAAQLISDIRYEVKDADGSEYNYPEPELLVYLSDAVEWLRNHISAIWPYYWFSTGQTYKDTQNIVSGTANYNLPADFFRIVAVSLTDSDGNTTMADELDFQRTFDVAAKGYYLLDSDIYIYPEPDANVADGLVIYYIPQITRLTAATDTVPLGDTWYGLLKEWVVVKCKARQEETLANFAGILAALKDQLTAMMHRTNLGTWTGWKTPGRNFV